MNKSLEYEIVSLRFYGQPKLTKPIELKGLSSMGSIKFLGRAACQYFIKGDDVYIKHTDYFSQTYREPEDIGTPLSYRMKKYNIASKKKDKFVYADNWGSIVLRNEAWIRLGNLMSLIKETKYYVSIANNIVQLQEMYHGFEDLDNEWFLFWERLCSQLTKINVKLKL